jgi:hypothetical protein
MYHRAPPTFFPSAVLCIRLIPNYEAANVAAPHYPPAGSNAAQYTRTYAAVHLLIHYGADCDVPITDKEKVETCLNNNMYEAARVRRCEHGVRKFKKNTIIRSIRIFEKWVCDIKIQQTCLKTSFPFSQVEVWHSSPGLLKHLNYFELAKRPLQAFMLRVLTGCCRASDTRLARLRRCIKPA